MTHAREPTSTGGWHLSTKTTLRSSVPGARWIYSGYLRASESLNTALRRAVPFVRPILPRVLAEPTVMVYEPRTW